MPHEPRSAGMYAAIEAAGSARPIRVTGHSLGAAVAVIATFDLLARGYKVVSHFSFGTPRVGNPAFAAAYDAECTIAPPPPPVLYNTQTIRCFSTQSPTLSTHTTIFSFPARSSPVPPLLLVEAASTVNL